MLSRHGMLVAAGAVLAATCTVLLPGTGRGSAAYPGANRRIAYVCTPDGMEIRVVDAHGSGLAYLIQYDRQGANIDERLPRLVA
jgi:hypothetical protein